VAGTMSVSYDDGDAEGEGYTDAPTHTRQHTVWSMVP